MAFAWRIVQAHVADRAFTGEGARRYGGRWNSKGSAVVYASSSISLAILEVLVHIPIYGVLEEYVCFPLEFDRDFVLSLDMDDLPDNWKRILHPWRLDKLVIFGLKVRNRSF